MRLEELSSESESTSVPRPQFGGPNRSKMPPKESLGDPLDAPWTALGSLRGSVGRSGGSWDTLWRSSGALWSSSGALWELWGMILELSGTIWKHFGMIIEPFFCPCCACCGSQHLALFWSFLGRSGVHRSRSSQNGRDRSRLVNTNEIATFSLTRELANISGTKPKQCWDELRIHMKILTINCKIES